MKKFFAASAEVQQQMCPPEEQVGEVGTAVRLTYFVVACSATEREAGHAEYILSCS
jgi:hypothetical protein